MSSRHWPPPPGTPVPTPTLGEIGGWRSALLRYARRFTYSIEGTRRMPLGGVAPPHAPPTRPAGCGRESAMTRLSTLMRRVRLPPAIRSICFSDRGVALGASGGYALAYGGGCAATGTVTSRGAAVAAGPPLVFLSYSRKDLKWCSDFDTLLRPVVRNGGLELWSDARLVPGDQWQPALRAAIDQSQAAVLLVSKDFLASRFIMDEELPALIASGARLLPVLVGDCLWEREPLLADVQWLHDPSRAIAAIASRPARTRVMVEVCRTLSDLELAGAADAPAVAMTQGATLPAVIASAHPGELDQAVPTVPLGFVEREELDALRGALLGAGAGSVGITGRPAMGLHGQGGIGKTVLAAALARDEGMRRHFPDGVYWVTLGERADLVGVQIELLRRLGAQAATLQTAHDGLKCLRTVLADRRCLLVVDDVWSAAAAEAFSVAGPESRVLYTTRDRAALAAVHADAYELGVLDQAAARMLLAGLAGVPAAELPADADRVIVATGGIALALALVGATVARGGRTWREAADDLKLAGETFLDHPYANTFKAIGLAVHALDDQVRSAYESLVVYPAGTIVPLAAVERWWAHEHTLPPEQTRRLLTQLADAGLLALNDEGIRFHDLQREYLLLHTDSVRLLHHELLESYRPLLPSPDAPWRALPHDEPYIWDHLMWHLCATGDSARARSLSTDLGYLALRCHLNGPHAAEIDVRRAATLMPGDSTVAWVQRRLGRSAHMLSGHERFDDLAATLLMHMGGVPSDADSDGLRALLPSQVLEARWEQPEASDALLRILEGHDDVVWDVAFSPDGGTVASASEDQTVRLWVAADGALRGVLEGHIGLVTAVAFAPDGRTLASASADQAIRLWVTTDGTARGVLQGHTGSVTALAFSPDGQTLASASTDETVRLWATTDAAVRGVLVGHHSWVLGVAFSPDGRTIASASQDGTVWLWDARDGAARSVLEGHLGGVTRVAFSPDGGTLASSSYDGTVRLWATADTAVRAVLEGHRGAVVALAFSPDGRTLASVGDDGAVRLWAAANGDGRGVMQSHRGLIRGVAFSPDGRNIASGGDDRSVRLWAAPDGAARSLLEGHDERVIGVAFSLDGRTLASAGEDETVRLWAAADGAARGVMQGHEGWVQGVAFSPDGRTIASGGADQTVRLWTIGNSAARAVLMGHEHRVNGVAFSPDGRTLASASNDWTIRLWAAPDETARGVLEGHHGEVTWVAFSPDGHTLASASTDGTVRLWSTVDGAALGIMQGHQRWVLGVAFSPDGRTVASAGSDGTVRLWAAANGSPCGVLEGHASSIHGIAFSPDGRTLASAGDQTVRLWEVADGAHTVATRFAGPVSALALRGNRVACAFGRTVSLMQVVERSALGP